jgi:hypothetical protein
MDHTTGPFAGGCQCGAVRYRAAHVLDSSHICHCRMCQKASGNFFAALVGVPRAAMEWTRGAPTLFASSDSVARGFCNQCGTPLTYDYHASKHLNITTGSLDDSSALPPKMQFGIEARMPWFGTLAALPDDGPTEKTMTGAVAAIRASNHQHPDHDTAEWPPA